MGAILARQVRRSSLVIWLQFHVEKELARPTNMPSAAVSDMQGILHGQARQHLGQLVFYIFVPCLTFTKLASSVDLNNLKIWWPLPVNTALR